MSITDDSESRAWLRDLFGTAEEDQDEDQQRPRSVPREGANPPSAITDEQRARDYARRLFNPEYAATEPELPS